MSLETRVGVTFSQADQISATYQLATKEYPIRPQRYVEFSRWGRDPDG